MKYIIYTMMVCCIFLSTGYSQFDLLKKAQKKIENKIEEKVDEELNKDKNKKEEKPAEPKEEVAAADNKTENNGTASANTESSSLKTYSKFDFVPGEKIIFFDDFALDNQGDFPQKWNTNGTGEVVTLNKFPGKWFKLKNSSTFLPYYSTNTFGPSFTIEFDLIADVPEKTNPGSLYIDLFRTENLDKVPQASSGPYTAGAFVAVHFSTSGTSNYNIHNTKTENKSVVSGGINNGLKDDAFKLGSINRVSISVNKQRYRLYVNDKKVFDLPRLMFPDENYNSIAFRTWAWNEAKEYQLLVGNFRIAEGQPETQSKLVTEGRFVTRGILFDSGSDKIKPESYGTLKEIATALNDNSGIKVKIIGHTDSDGDDKSNLDLSERRAEAVKNALNTEFGIDLARFEAAGKGESEPVTANDSPEGKANNRRVEFVKL